MRIMRVVGKIRPLIPIRPIRQTACFDPVGLAGLMYWYALFPLHQLIFSGMLRNIARRVESGRTPPHSPRQ